MAKSLSRFFIRKQDEKNEIATLFFRVQNKKHKVDMLFFLSDLYECCGVERGFVAS